MEHEITDWKEEVPEGFSEYLKECWRSGEWENETDYASFKYRGYPCTILRNRFGALCGYVFLGLDHPWVDSEDEYCVVHGGITFSKNQSLNGIDYYVIGFDCAHSEDLIPYDYWKALERYVSLIPNDDSMGTVRGFLEQQEEAMRGIEENIKKYGSLYEESEETYKNINFVKREIMSLVDQAIEAYK